MEQRWRRGVYVLAGVIPAATGTVFVSLLSIWAALLPAVGALGLLLATVVQLPASGSAYGRISVLLFAGLVAALPGGALLCYLLLQGIPDHQPFEFAQSLAGRVAGVAWLCLGPVGCAFHFFRHGRCAPNNSSKPTPLRGAA